jgi:GT2 family glycosyltransferase
MVMGLCAVHRVEVLRGVGGFDERFISCGEDVEMSVRLRKFGYRLAYRPDAYGDHLRHDTDESLIRRMAGYVTCTSHALMLHGKRPRRYFAPILVKQAILHPLRDVIRGRFDLLTLDFAINRARWKALMALKPEDVM